MKVRKAGKIETIFGTKRFMSVATIKRMRKADLDDWLFQRGFMPEAFDNNKEKRAARKCPLHVLVCSVSNMFAILAERAWLVPKFSGGLGCARGFVQTFGRAGAPPPIQQKYLKLPAFNI